MLKNSKWIKRVLEPVYFVEFVARFFVLWALILVIFDPLGYVAIVTSTVTIRIIPFHHYWTWIANSCHKLTFLCLSYLFLCFWRKMRDVPYILIRFLLTALFLWISWQTYEFFWHLVVFGFYGLFLNVPNLPRYTPQDFCLFLLVSHAIPCLVLTVLSELKSDWAIPRIKVKRFVLIMGLTFLMILWLDGSGFFYEYYRVGWLGQVYPHSWVWFIGKAVSLLSWAFVTGGHLRLRTLFSNIKYGVGEKIFRRQKHSHKKSEGRKKGVKELSVDSSQRP